MTKNECYEILHKLIDYFYFDDNILFLPKSDQKIFIAQFKDVKRERLSYHKNEISEFLMSHAKAVHYSHVVLEKDTGTLNILKDYRRSINLTSIKPDIKYMFGSYAKALYMQWSNPNGMGMDVIAQELKDRGVHLSGISPADQFIEMVELYKRASQEVGLTGKYLKTEMSENTEKEFRQFIAKELKEFAKTPLKSESNGGKGKSL